MHQAGDQYAATMIRSIVAHPSTNCNTARIITMIFETTCVVLSRRVCFQCLFNWVCFARVYIYVFVSVMYVVACCVHLCVYVCVCVLACFVHSVFLCGCSFYMLFCCSCLSSQHDKSIQLHNNSNQPMRGLIEHGLQTYGEQNVVEIV